MFSLFRKHYINICFHQSLHVFILFVSRCVYQWPRRCRADFIQYLSPLLKGVACSGSIKVGLTLESIIHDILRKMLTNRAMLRCTLNKPLAFRTLFTYLLRTQCSDTFSRSHTERDGHFSIRNWLFSVIVPFDRVTSHLLLRRLSHRLGL